jgi:TIR domain
MTVYIAHAPEDAEAAQGLETFLERRGLFVHREDGAQGFRPLLRTDVVVMMWSGRALFMTHRLIMERRALDAWAEGRLVSVKLDHGIMPVGMRDLKVIEATFEPQRDIAWAAVHKAIQEALEGARRLEAELSRAGSPGTPGQIDLDEVAPAPSSEAGKGGGLWAWVVIGVLVLGLALGAALLLAGVPWQLWAVVAGAVAICALAAAYAVNRVRARDQEDRLKARPPGAPPAAEYERSRSIPPQGGEDSLVFVSYARADLATVGPVVDELKAAGQAVWIDKEAIQPGEGWAGEIVRAIKAAESVCVMCSGAAFQSDHVKREVYLADRYRRPLTPVFLDDAPPPEDFEYFFAGLQHLKLSELPADGRGQALAQVLGAR